MIFCQKENRCIFAAPKGNAHLNAEVAQLVEHDLAKVGVAGSSPVFRSNPGSGRDFLLRRKNLII